MFCPQQHRDSREAGFSGSVMEHTGRHLSLAGAAQMAQSQVSVQAGDISLDTRDVTEAESQHLREAIEE